MTGDTPDNPFYASLANTDRMLSRRYGKAERHYIAHTPLLLERDLISELEQHFSKEFFLSSASRVRSHNNVQFAMAFNYFLMSERREVPLEQIFDELDADHSGDLGASELHTALTRLRPLPLKEQDVSEFKESWHVRVTC